MIAVERRASEEDFDEVRTLMRTSVAWHRERHAEDLHLIDAYFDDAAFEHELARLPEYYAPPDGDLLLARGDGTVTGCVAVGDLTTRPAR